MQYSINPNCWRQSRREYLVARGHETVLGDWWRMRKVTGVEHARNPDLPHALTSAAVVGTNSLPAVGKILGYTHVQTIAR